MPDRNMLRLDLIFLKKSKQAAAAAVGVEDRSELKKKVFFERVHDRGDDGFLLQTTSKPTSTQEIVYNIWSTFVTCIRPVL